MDIKVIKEIMREFKTCGLTKLDIKHDDIEIKMEKKKEVASMAHSVETIPSCSVTREPQQDVYEASQATGCAIVSPMVGTVYTAPNPESAPYVSLGQRIKKGDVVCIIEAMKLMNEVESEVDGVVTEIVAKNEQMVEFGAPLFIIEPQA